jgi:hypothetical protein
MPVQDVWIPAQREVAFAAVTRQVRLDDAVEHRDQRRPFPV